MKIKSTTKQQDKGIQKAGRCPMKKKGLNITIIRENKARRHSELDPNAAGVLFTLSF